MGKKFYQTKFGKGLLKTDIAIAGGIRDLGGSALDEIYAPAGDFIRKQYDKKINNSKVKLVENTIVGNTGAPISGPSGMTGANLLEGLKSGGKGFLGGVYEWFSGTKQGAYVNNAAKNLWWESNRYKVFGVAAAFLGAVVLVLTGIIANPFKKSKYGKRK